MNKKKLPLTSIAVPLALVALTAGCGGSVGGQGGQGSGESASGFEFGAPQDEVDAALEDLEPLTLTFQPYSQSPASAGAEEAEAFKTAVEERSAGKITVDIAWGFSIAEIAETDDALAGGRLDVAYFTPVYKPNDYPVFDAYNNVSYSVAAEPITGEAATLATMVEAGWNSPQLLEEFTGKGLTPLNPSISTGNYWAACNTQGTSLDDWAGRQIRIGGSAQTALAEEVGATPVSMVATEAYEALQRGTVDCTFAQGVVAGAFGISEVAPYLSTFGDGGMGSVATSNHLAGSSFETLPLPYQQIIFDASAVEWSHGQIHNILGESAHAIGAAREAGGGIEAMDPAAEQAMTGAQEATIDGLIEEGLLEDGIRDELAQTADKWLGITEELGYTDGGELADFDEWFEPESLDFRPLTERLAEEAALPHRPQ